MMPSSACGADYALAARPELIAADQKRLKPFDPSNRTSEVYLAAYRSWRMFSTASRMGYNCDKQTITEERALLLRLFSKGLLATTNPVDDLTRRQGNL